MIGKHWIAAILLVSTHLGYAADESFYKTHTTTKQIKIMSYNVENLFDATHDEGKNDYEFLPKTDPNKSKCPKGGAYAKSCVETNWTTPKVRWKLDAIRQALDEQGDYPDILVLSEVENQDVVGDLAAHLGYSKFVMTTSPDQRGIDLAVLYNVTHLKFLSFEEVKAEGVPFATRHTSAVHFEVTMGRSSAKHILGVYPAHWPSQGSEDPKVRIAAGMSMRKMIDKYTTKYTGQNYYAVALGDFNCLESEVPNPLREVVLNPSWKNRMYDTEALAKTAKHPYLKFFPPGTYYYGTTGEWNKFDRIFVSKTLKDGRGLEIKPLTYRVNSPMLVSRLLEDGQRIPYRYNHAADNKKWTGFSDHYAVHVMLEMQ